VGAAGLGGQALDHFLLQHEVHVGDRPGGLEQMHDQRRGDVVGQVTHHPQRRAVATQGGEVEGQGIALVNHEIRVLEELHTQAGDQIAVELDHLQGAAGSVDQRLGQRSLAGADLDQALAGTGVDGPHDARDDARIAQEVLAEALAGPMHGWA